MLVKTLLITFLLMITKEVSSSKIALPEDMYLSVTELIKYRGYPAESHQVVTQDGYYLTLHRIPYGHQRKANFTGDEKNTSRPVMLMLPGLLLESAAFVSSLPHQALGYILADAGYDVWMGNNRGTTYSKRHKSLPVDSSEFWDFSFDEMAKYDLPGMVDYILEKTNQKQLFYLGYSQGSTIGFTALSSNPKLQKQIKKFFAMTPVTRSAAMPPLSIRIMGKLVMNVLKAFGMHELMPHNQYAKFVAEIACPLDPELCRDIIIKQCGGEPESINATRLPLVMMHIPSGTSVKNMDHFTQVVYTNRLRMFNYGLLGNLLRYKSFSPPLYDLKAIDVPTVLISGTEDWRANPRDVAWTASQLKHVERIVVEGYGHCHFFMATDAKEKFIDKVVSLMK